MAIVTVRTMTMALVMVMMTTMTAVVMVMMVTTAINQSINQSSLFLPFLPRQW